MFSPAAPVDYHTRLPTVTTSPVAGTKIWSKEMAKAKKRQKKKKIKTTAGDDMLGRNPTNMRVLMRALLEHF